MTCDHTATKASFAAFFGATKLIGGQDDGESGWLLLGTCVACNTTLAIPIAEPRGRAVHGEIIDSPPPVRSAGKVARHLEDLETMEEHAARVIK